MKLRPQTVPSARFLLLFVLLSSASVQVRADVIQEGFRGISITCQIENKNDFPDYVFLSASPPGGLNGGSGPMHADISEIGQDGTIRSYYKFCPVSVYALKRSSLGQKKVVALTDRDLGELLKIPGNREVICHVLSHAEVPKASGTMDYTLGLRIDLNRTIDAMAEAKRVETKNVILLGVSFILDVLVELAILCLIMRTYSPRLGLVVLLLNAITWPLANYFAPLSPFHFIVAEILVFAFEALGMMMLLKVKLGQACWISFLANSATCFLGLLFPYRMFF